MFIARDTTRGAVVSGPEVSLRSIECPEILESRFECVVCGSPLRFIDDSTDEYFGYFDNEQCDCIKDGNMSAYHRLAEEVTAKQLVNLIPCSPGSIDIDVEGRIGTNSDFVVADICLRHPVKLAVEVIYTNTNIRFHRRLRTLFRAGYAVTFVIVDDAVVSQAHIDSQLREFGDFRVGVFDPDTLNLDFGTIIGPEQIGTAL